MCSKSLLYSLSIPVWYIRLLFPKQNVWIIILTGGREFMTCIFCPCMHFMGTFTFLHGWTQAQHCC